MPETVDRNIGNDNVSSIWKTIDSKLAQLQPTSTIIIKVQQYLEDSII